MKRRIHGLFRPGRLRGPTPDVRIDFETGAGIPTANGGRGDAGASLVTITSPQSGAGFLRRRLRPSGYSLFEPKPANQLVGWPGPGTGSYWAGPMPGITSTSQTVSVYSTTSGLTVSAATGGVVGAAAIRCDVDAGRDGLGWGALPAASRSSGWGVSADGLGTVAYLHAVVELLGSVADHKVVLSIYDVGGAADIGIVTQRYDAAGSDRSGVVHRGTGPNGGQVYEVWAVASLTSEPVGPIEARARLLASGSDANPARSIIIHGAQSYLPRWDSWSITGLLPFFSYATGSAVAWTTETLSINHTGEAVTAALNYDMTVWSPLLTASYTRLLTRDSDFYTKDYIAPRRGAIGAYSPMVSYSDYSGRVVLRTGSDRARALTLDGAAIVDAGAFDDPFPPEYVLIGGFPPAFGRWGKVHVWTSALTDAEMLAAFQDV